MSTLVVGEYTLHLDWFCGVRSMKAFGYAIERILKLKQVAKDGIIHDGYDQWDANKIKVKLDGIYSSVMLDQVDIGGSTTDAETGKIYLTKKEVDEFFDTISVYKKVKL